MITNKARAKIAELSAQLVTERLKSTAYEQVVENFCVAIYAHGLHPEKGWLAPNQ